MKAEDIEMLLGKYAQMFGQVPEWAETYAEHMPELLGPWLEIRSKVMCDGALPQKMKELMLVAINLVRRYPLGVEAHLKNAMDQGATDAEVMETIITAVLSSAAPAMYNGPLAFNAELKKRR